MRELSGVLITVKVILVYTNYIFIINVLHLDRIVHIHFTSVHRILLYWVSRRRFNIRSRIVLVFTLQTLPWLIHLPLLWRLNRLTTRILLHIASWITLWLRLLLLSFKGFQNVLLHENFLNLEGNFFLFLLFHSVHISWIRVHDVITIHVYWEPTLLNLAKMCHLKRVPAIWFWFVCYSLFVFLCCDY